MIDYIRYMDVAGIMQKDMVAAIQHEFPDFDKVRMSLACNPAKNALCLIPEAEKLVEAKFGRGPGLSITPKFGKTHDNKNKPNRLYVRLDNSLRSRVQTVYEQMCFASMQDLLESAISQFVEKYERSA